MITINPGVAEDIESIQVIAEATWWPTYSPILSRDQIAYMLHAIYSTDTLTSNIKSGKEKFLILREGDQTAAFASFSMLGSIVKLHKLYVHLDYHKKGFGSMLLDEVKRQASGMGANVLELNVNRHNPAKSFYEKAG